jgi:uncharacterized membrane protein
LLINQFYDNEITSYKEGQEADRLKTSETYAAERKKSAEAESAEAEALAKKRSEFETKWRDTSKLGRLEAIEEERKAELALAKDIGASAETVYNINKYYDDLRVKSNAEMITGIVNSVSSISGAIGGDGDKIVSKITGVVTDVVKAVASGGADIASIISAVVGIIGLAGEANAEKMERIQEKFAEFGQELLTVLAPVLEFVLDVLEMIFPVLELFIPLLKYILAPLNLILSVLSPLIELFLMFNPIIILLRLIAPLLDGIANGINGLADGLKDLRDIIADIAMEGFEEMTDKLKPMSDAFDEFSENLNDKALAGLEKFKTKTADIFIGIKDGLVGIFTGFSDIIKTPINFIITGINALIRAINSISITIPDWVPSIGGKTIGFNLDSIPMLAKGTDSFEGGLALVGEQGPEFRYLEKGTQITPAGKTQSLLENSGKKEYNINATFNSPKAMNQKEQMYAVKKWGEDLAFQGVI